ncbi:DUF6368 family protein [Streptomyces sp. NPDC002387]|uniref:DUF6368 family protein n=1 Tax=Streptomyces sp. NPDC002387 TaxID=3364643 RepID=UPI00367C6E64
MCARPVRHVRFSHCGRHLPWIGRYFPPATTNLAVPSHLRSEAVALLSPGRAPGPRGNCSGPDNHRLLGHLTRFLAEHYDALIDFGGLLQYRHFRHALSGQEETDRLAASRALVSTLPGRIWEMPYATEAGGCGYSHVGDRAFLTAWLDHPEFRMIK